MSLVLQRFDSSNIELVCDYIESIREFDEITREIPKDRAACEEKLVSLLDSEQAIGVVVFDTEAVKIVGIGIITVIEMWWTSQKTWNNVLFYVEQNSRRTRAFKMLMDFFKGISDKTGIPLYFDLVSPPDTNFAVYDKVFKYQGLQRVGTSFLYKKAA